MVGEWKGSSFLLFSLCCAKIHRRFVWFVGLRNL